ncbi:hypothetical protein IBL25_20475, partial [Roseomonas ludipueritiae]
MESPLPGFPRCGFIPGRQKNAELWHAWPACKFRRTGLNGVPPAATLQPRNDSGDGGHGVRFRTRAEAGRALARRLGHLRDAAPVVLALPRGGVPVGLEVAAALAAPLDLLLVRKIGAPGYPELAAGAVAEQDSAVFINEDVVRELDIPRAYLEAEAARQRAEIGRRRGLYRQGRAPLPLAGRSAILV